MRAIAYEPGRSDRQDEDRFVVRRGVSWPEYQQVLEERGEHSAPRIAYLEGLLEIMSPGERHENLKERIGCLVETWCQGAGRRVRALRIMDAGG